MAHPDITSNLGTASIGLCIIFIYIIVFFIFNAVDNGFSWGLSIGTVITVFFTSLFLNAASQWRACKTLYIMSLLKSTYPSLITTVIGYGIASISICRIPVASAIAPFFKGKTVDVIKGKSNSNSTCCNNKQVVLEDLEKENPLIKGFSFAFYVSIAFLYGLIWGYPIVVESC